MEEYIRKEWHRYRSSDSRLGQVKAIQDIFIEHLKRISGDENVY